MCMYLNSLTHNRKNMISLAVRFLSMRSLTCKGMWLASTKGQGTTSLPAFAGFHDNVLCRTGLSDMQEGSKALHTSAPQRGLHIQTSPL